MRTVSDEYLAQVQSGARRFGFAVKVYGNAAEPDTLLLGDIISVEVTRSISDGLQIGACMSDKLTLQTRATALFNGRGKKVEVFCRCTAPDTVWSRLGTFYVSECVTESGVTAVEAYDMMSRLDKRVSWIDTSRATAPTFPCKMQAVLNYLCARAGVTTDFACQDITITNAPDGYTARELISYIAASHGANARFSPSEILKIRPYAAVAKTIERGRCYSLTAGSDECTVNGILFDKGADNKVYIDGTSAEYDEDAEGVVEAFNPFVTVGIAEYAWGQLGGFSYSAVSLEMPAENILEPGDVFTVALADGKQKTAVVMEQRLTASCTGGFVESISCTAESKAQKRDINNRTEAAEKVTSAQPTAPLAEYAVTSDSVVKYNGVTYTAEFAEGGAIAKISDDKGGEFEPTFAAGVTNIALHNAVFWAVAMVRGLRRPAAADALTKMCAYRYNCDSMAQSGANITWHNQAAGGNVDCTLHDAEIIDNHVRLYGRNTSYGYISSIAMSMQGYTVYLVAQAINVVPPCRTMSIRAGIEFIGHGGYWCATRGINSNYVTSEIPATQLCVLAAAVYSDGAMRWWINGAEQTSAGSSGLFGSSAVDIRRTLDNYFDGSTIDYYDIAFANAPHTDSEIAANSAYLMQKYNVQ